MFIWFPQCSRLWVGSDNAFLNFQGTSNDLKQHQHDMYYRILREVLWVKEPSTMLSLTSPVRRWKPGCTAWPSLTRSQPQRLAAPRLGSRSLGSNPVCFSSPALNSENHWLPFWNRRVFKKMMLYFQTKPMFPLPFCCFLFFFNVLFFLKGFTWTESLNYSKGFNSTSSLLNIQGSKKLGMRRLGKQKADNP